MPISRPCYTTREDVRSALDIQQASYADRKIDRALMSGSDSVDRLCMRKFYTKFTTYHWDWPNFQYAYPWQLWLDQRELAGVPSLVESGTFLSSPVQIPVADILFLPEDGPPYTGIELRRDLSYAFGYNTTPQWDINITGPFGYWMQTVPASSLAVALSDTTTTTVQAALGGYFDVGDTLIIDSEYMLVTDSQYISTGISFTAGCTTASAADNTMTVPDGTKFTSQEIILVDSEWILIQSVIGNNLIVKRAYSGSVLTTHSLGDIYAKRQFTVTRGVLGTTAASHSQGTQMYIRDIPGLVKELATAEAVVTLIQSTAGYANDSQATWRGQRQQGEGSQVEAWPGTGIPDLRQRCAEAYARQARSRVI
jgi:hypothetical protein